MTPLTVGWSVTRTVDILDAHDSSDCIRTGQWIWEEENPSTLDDEGWTDQLDQR